MSADVQILEVTTADGKRRTVHAVVCDTKAEAERVLADHKAMNASRMKGPT